MSPRKHSVRKLRLVWITACLAVLCSSCEQKQSALPKPQPDTTKTQESSPDPGEMDQALTEAATKALGDREGTILVIDPQTGRLRALVNPRLAFEQAFPPGSTIKAFTALTALRAGLIDRESRTLCRGRFTTDGLDVVCSHPKSNAPFNLSHALGYSCNYFFATLSGRISFGSFKNMLAGAGFGEKTGVNSNGESPGMLRDGNWRLRDLLGEGDNLLVTPIQLVTAYCALFNGGHLYRPFVSDQYESAASERSRLHIDESQRSVLVEGLRGAVAYGTAEKAGLASLPIFIFGKTGTSTSSNGFRRQGWFVSFAANAHSAIDVIPESLELAVLVFLKRSHGSDAAAVSRSIFEEYIKKKTGEAARSESVGPSSIPASRQSLRVRINSENRVVTVPLEDYVLGVVSAEATVEDQIEALKAQAIVSRTYALKNSGRHSDEGFDLCSNTHCQQYMADVSKYTKAMRRAVLETAGAVLVDANGQMADVYFHAACGGHTANFEALWGSPGPSYLNGVRDDNCISMPHRDWTDEIPVSKLVHALATDPRTDAGHIKDIVITSRDESGRAEMISIEGERRRQIRGWAFKLIVGRTLGWNLLKSSRFSVRRNGANFVFRGTGFGHGLGLCQNGAHVIARRGGSSEQILQKYFPGTLVSASGQRVAVGGEKVTVVGYGSVQRVGYTAPTSRFGRERNYSAEISGIPQVLSSEHFRVTFRGRVPRSETETILRLLEAARLDMLARVDQTLLMRSEGAIEVVVHETTPTFCAATGQPWWVAGVTRGRRIEIQPVTVLKQRRIFESTLRHEYAHAVIEAIGMRTPRWLAEGLAISFAGEGRMLSRFRPSSPISIDTLEQKLSHPKSPGEMRALYAAAYAAVQRLIRLKGERAVWNRVLTSRLVEGRSAYAGKELVLPLSSTGRLGGELY